MRAKKILSSDLEFQMVFKYLDAFGKWSGIKVNVNKTQVVDFKSNISCKLLKQIKLRSI